MDYMSTPYFFYVHTDVLFATLGQKESILFTLIAECYNNFKVKYLKLKYDKEYKTRRLVIPLIKRL